MATCLPVSHEGYELLHHGQIALSEVEANGMRVDTAYLDRKIAETDKHIKALSQGLRTDKDCQQVVKAWRKRYGEKTNLGSREQLGTVLFEVLKLKGGEYTARSLQQKEEDSETKLRYKADKSALEDMEGVPFVRKFLELEKLKKAYNTYFLGIKREIDTRGFIHPSYGLNTVISYRSSCVDPAMQTIPIRDPEVAGLIRPMFIPRHPTWCVVERDFSGAEVRTACAYTKDANLIAYMLDKGDMHLDSAKDCFILKKLDPNTKEGKALRDVAKGAWTFAQFYGDFFGGCGRNLWRAIDHYHLTTEAGVPLKKHLRKHGIESLGEVDKGEEPRPGTFLYHLKKVEHTFWKVRFKEYDQWKWDIWNQYCEDGFVDSLTGFRYTALMNRKQVQNFQIQGSSFHLLLWVLIQTAKALRRYKLKCRLMGEIHDSMLSDCPEKELKDYGEITEEIIAVKLPKRFPWLVVPMKSSLEVSPAGASWLEKKKYKLQ